MTRHRFDPFSFLVGALAVAAAVIVLVEPAALRLLDLRVAGPIALLAIGLALLLSGSGGGSPAAAAGSEPEPDETPADDEAR
jgi:uncharacterized membrane protein (DUF4010 family)